MRFRALLAGAGSVLTTRQLRGRDLRLGGLPDRVVELPGRPVQLGGASASSRRAAGDVDLVADVATQPVKHFPVRLHLLVGAGQHPEVAEPDIVPTVAGTARSRLSTASARPSVRRPGGGGAAGSSACGEGGSVRSTATSPQVQTELAAEGFPRDSPLALA